MNLMLKEEWICPPSLLESVRIKARGSVLATKDDYESITVASTSYSSPPTEAGVSADVASLNNTPEKSTTCPVSEEILEQEKVQELRFLKGAFDFLKLLARKLKFSQTIINSAMFYLLKYTRVYPYTSMNKYLVAASCLLLAAKVRTEPIPMEYLVEWYIWAEYKRINSKANPHISDKMKSDYRARIEEQEFDILSELNFDVEVDLPNKYIAKYLCIIQGKTVSKNPLLLKYAYMFMNDAFKTTVPLFYTPQELAATVVYMADVYQKKAARKARPAEPISEETEEEWLKRIDPTLDLKHLTEVKDEIKKCYLLKTSSS